MPTIGNLGTLYVRNKDGVLEEVPVICGKDGAPGTPPHIGDNGNWWIGDTDTGVIAKYDDFIDKAETAYDKSFDHATKYSFTTSNGESTNYYTLVLQDGTEIKLEFPSVSTPNAVKREKGTPSGDGSGLNNAPFWLDTSTGILYVYTGQNAMHNHIWKPVNGRQFIKTGSGEPIASSSDGTLAMANDLYVDTDTGYVYLCTDVVQGMKGYTYTWLQVGGKPGTGGGGGGTSFEVGEGLKLEDGILSLDAHEITNEELQEIINQVNGG